MGRDQGKKLSTYEDIEALPVGWVGELINGDLVVSPRPATQHLRVVSRLGALLASPFEFERGGPGGWWFFDEPELHFDRNVLVPDLAGWCRERVPEPPDAPWLTLVPDWICEVLSPATRTVDLARKMPQYYREGVRHLWLIEPEHCSLESYRRGQDRWERSALYTGNGTVKVEPFHAVPLELGLLWLPRRRGPERQILPY